MAGLRAAVVPVTPFQQNCAIAWDEASKRGAVVDPGGEVPRILDAIRQLGVGVERIVLTHGHIDHAGGAAELKDWTGAPIYAHPLEQRHIDGTYPYSGFAWLTGALEAAGRRVTGYRRVAIDVPIADGDELALWGGLQVVHLPGHTDGHCGFFSARHRLLFTGDLWVRFMMRTQVSPRIFSDDISQVPGSMRKARSFGARWVIPGHYDLPDGAWLRHRFEDLCDELDRREEPAV